MNKADRQYLTSLLQAWADNPAGNLGWALLPTGSNGVDFDSAEGAIPPRLVVSYGTEAGHFQAAGYSAVVCGPGSIAQAHQPDEFITVKEFEAGHDFMKRLVARLSA